jgi:hypothetical protein
MFQLIENKGRRLILIDTKTHFLEEKAKPRVSCSNSRKFDTQKPGGHLDWPSAYGPLKCCEVGGRAARRREKEKWKHFVTVLWSKF